MTRHTAHIRAEIPNLNRLFVYGIFLGEGSRNRYGMTNPQYATVSGYTTIGRHIVEAYNLLDDRFALTGLTVDVNPEYWERIDGLEAGYHRTIVTTENGEQVYMYISRSSPDNEIEE